LNYQKYRFGEILGRAKEKNYAVGAFNIFNYLSAKAVVDAAEELKAPAILQTSMGTVREFGAKKLFDMVQSVRNGATVPILLHLDHCRDLSLLQECVDAGWDSVMIDASSKPFKENVETTLRAKEYASKKDVAVESELGVIIGTEDEISTDKEVGTNYEDALSFLAKTKVDAFAPAIGTAHGIYKTQAAINYALVKRLSQASEVPVVIHGGTGLSEKQFSRLVKSGGAKINISTALKHAYIDSIRDYQKNNPEQYAPLDLDKAADDAIKTVVKKHMICFGSAEKY